MKGVVTPKTPAEYIRSLEGERKKEIQELHKLICATVPKLKPFMQGGMIGYGKYHYKYASGREGDWFYIGLCSRKQYISLYACMCDGKQYLAEKYKKELPKANIGRSCIRFKRIEDVDLAVLKKLFKETQKLMQLHAVHDL